MEVEVVHEDVTEDDQCTKDATPPSTDTDVVLPPTSTTVDYTTSRQEYIGPSKVTDADSQSQASESQVFKDTSKEAEVLSNSSIHTTVPRYVQMYCIFV